MALSFPKLPRFFSPFRNFFILSGSLLAAWLLFFDENNLFNQLSMRSKMRELQKEKEYFTARLEQVKKEQHQLFSNSKNLEKFAREKYIMRKPNEDVYVVIEE